MKLIVGLGNPGKQYNNTRHNIGFMCIDSIANYFKVHFDCNKFNGLYAQFNYNNEKIILLKPQKFMNLSGEVVRDFVNFFKIDIQNVIVICDDLNIEIGKYKLKYKGSSGGHNGLKNIEQNLSTREYKRIKVGISNDKSKDTKDYVLGKFSSDELNLIKTIVDQMPNIIEDYLKLSFDNLMNKYN